MDLFRFIVLLCILLTGTARKCPAGVTTVGDASVGSDIRITEQADGSVTVTPPDMLSVSEISIARFNFGTMGVAIVDGTTIEATGEMIVVEGIGSVVVIGTGSALSLPNSTVNGTILSSNEVDIARQRLDTTIYPQRT